MLEAVSTVIQTAPLARPSSEQVSTADSFAANPERTQRVQRAPFISPVVAIDFDFDTAVLEIRNATTGDVVEQIPSDSRLEAQRRNEARREAAQTQQLSELASQGESATTSVQSSSPSSEAGSAPAPTQVTQAGQEARIEANAINAQQLQAFQSAAQSGNSNAGNVTLFA